MDHEAAVQTARQADALFNALVDDVIAATEVWHQRNDAFSHRLYVRTVFAFVEGIIQVMKSAALLLDEMLNEPRLLSAEEITLLKEEDVQLGWNGEVEVKKMKTPLLPNFQFAFVTYAKVQERKVNLDKSGEGWRQLKQAIRIRDRLMHPHKIEDLVVTEADLRTVEGGVRFFRDTTGQLLHAPQK